MSKKNMDHIRIISSGKPKLYKYKLEGDGAEFNMGTFEMYNQFLLNFNDSSNVVSFFTLETNRLTTNTGLLFFTEFLSPDCPLFIPDVSKIEEYHGMINNVFAIITSAIRQSKVGKSTGDFKVKMSQMSLLAKNKAKKYSQNSDPTSQLISSLLMRLSDEFKITESSKIMTHVAINTTENSIEKTLNDLRINIERKFNSSYLSSLDSSVFETIRNFCIKSIGEGTKVEEVTERGIELLRLRTISSINNIRESFKKNGNDFMKINPRKESILNIFEIFCNNPKLTMDLVMLLKEFAVFYPELKDIDLLVNIFVGTTDEYVFSNLVKDKLLINGTRRSVIKKIFKKEESDDSDSDDAGFFRKPKQVTSKMILSSSESSSSDSDDEKEFVKSIPVDDSESDDEITKLPKKEFVKSIPVYDSESDESNESDDEYSDTDSDEESKFLSAKEKWLKRGVRKNLIITRKGKPKQIKDTGVIENKIEVKTNLSSDFFNFSISVKTIEILIKIIKDSNSNLYFDQEFHNKMTTGKISDKEGELKLDWWQKEFKTSVVNGESTILVGDTSGGKTFIAISSIRDLYLKISKSSSNKIVYLAPTSQLAILQFANMLTMYPEDFRNFGICCKSNIDIPPTWKVIFGTPAFVKRFLYNTVINERDNISFTPDNFKNEITDVLSRSNVTHCSTLFIDEVQTLSLKYVENQEIEYKMECKSIEDIIKCCKSYGKDGKFTPGQIACISATLSNDSIINLKNKISELTGISNIKEVKYSHEDIGLNDLSLKSSFKPIMKKPDFLFVKTNAGLFESYNIDDKIENQQYHDEYLEMIIRDARDSGVFPLSIFTKDELSTVRLFKYFLTYIKRKCSECFEWKNLFHEYINNGSYDFSQFKGGITNEIGIKKQNEWLKKIGDKIKSVANDTSLTSVIKFNKSEDRIISNVCKILEIENQSYSPELYGLCYEYNMIRNWENPFETEIHPFYRYGGSFGGDFFSLYDSSGNKTDLCKILEAQDVDIKSENSIIPLILEGFKYGMSIITSSIPLGFQLEIFKFINIKSKFSGNKNPIPILFSEYVMSMGMNLSTMSVAIIRNELMDIGTCEYLQIVGRAGRRGNKNESAPKIYTFNIRNVNSLKYLEILDFNTSSLKSDFFEPNELINVLCNLLIKFNSNFDEIEAKNISAVETFLSNSIFKFLNTTELTVRKIQLAKFQLTEIYSRCKHIFPKICDNLTKIFRLLQKSEFHYMNDQIV